MNPFIQNFLLDVVKVNTTYLETRSDSMQDGFIGKYKKVEESFLAERQDKTAVYEIPYIENVLFKTMNSCGRDLLLYIIYNIKKNTDTIDLKPEKICKEMNNSRPTYYKAVADLVDAGIICKKQTTSYWINPFYLFKGNRIDYYNKNCPECIKIVAITDQSKLPNSTKTMSISREPAASDN